MTEMADPIERSESFECDGPAELDIRLRTGRVEVRAAEVTHVRVGVSLEPRPRSPSGDRLESMLERVSAGAYDPLQVDEHFLRETQITFSKPRRKLLVQAPRALQRVRLAVVIEAPQASKLKAQVHRGSVTVCGTLSGLVAATGSGSISVEGVEGSAEIATGSGDIKLGRIAGRLHARTGSGELDVASVEGERAKLTTGRGDVWLGLVSCDAHVRTGRGNVVVTEAACGDLSVMTGSGDVQVAIQSGVTAELDVASGSGNARSELDVSDQRPAGRASLRVRARTGSGDAVVTSAGG